MSDDSTLSETIPESKNPLTEISIDDGVMSAHMPTAKPTQVVAALPVEVANTNPLIVEVVSTPSPMTGIGPGGPPTSPATVVKGEGTTLPPTTTEEGDKVTAGQRHINVLWESSQSVISVAITGAVIYCQINGIQSETLNNAFFFVVATYLQRTNHVRIGGVGPKYDEVYRGR